MSIVSRKLIATTNLSIFNNIRYLSVQSSALCASNKYKNDLTKTTHTGQVWDDKDYRNVRFTNAARQVNENWGIKLIDEIPPKECTDRVIYCDGGNGPLGHPKVYINLDKPGAHACGYCGLRFIKKDEHHH